MDTRQLKTRRALFDAILSLAAETPVDDITVTALAQRAGITRETFYRHSDSPVDLLAVALAEDLGALAAVDEVLPARSETGESVFRAPTAVLIEHMSRHADIYRRAMNPHLNARLRESLTNLVTWGLMRHLDAHPEIAPTIGGEPADAIGRRVLVAYAASGTIGAIELWLSEGDPSDLDGATEAILAAAPEWWQGLS